MLTQILQTHLLRTGAVVVGVTAGLAYLLAGPSAAWAVVLGGVLVGGSGAVQIWIVGQLIDPLQEGSKKAVAGVMLLFKLVAVAGLLWWILSSLGPDLLGLMVGMCAGLVSLVLGLKRGSMSQEGQQAIEAAEQAIAREEETRKAASEAEDDDLG